MGQDTAEERHFADSLRLDPRASPLPPPSHRGAHRARHCPTAPHSRMLAQSHSPTPPKPPPPPPRAPPTPHHSPRDLYSKTMKFMGSAMGINRSSDVRNGRWTRTRSRLGMAMELAA